MARRREFGSVRKLPSGRWQARYPDPAGCLVGAPETFASKSAASTYLAQVEADRSRGSWVDPAAGAMAFGDYSASWLAQRPGLRPRTIELYGSLLRRHLLPTFGSIVLVKITPGSVRQWHAARIATGVGTVTVAKAYRLLKTILGTAVSDEILLRNPCVLRGVSAERSPERHPPTLAEVEALASAVEPRYRLLVLLGAWSGLRWGELVGLTRRRVDLLHGTVHVVEQLVESGGTWHLGPPKTDAGRRIVHLPPHLIADVESHLLAFVDGAPDALIFTGPLGAPLRRGNFSNKWAEARASVDLPHVHFHDLRHLAATLAATTGATTRELMARMGHSSPRAALIYQHATGDRDAAIAQALSVLAEGRSDSCVALTHQR